MGVFTDKKLLKQHFFPESSSFSSSAFFPDKISGRGRERLSGLRLRRLFLQTQSCKKFSFLYLLYLLLLPLHEAGSERPFGVLNLDVINPGRHVLG
jgi:hypothetical protein